MLRLAILLVSVTSVLINNDYQPKTFVIRNARSLLGNSTDAVVGTQSIEFWNDPSVPDEGYGNLGFTAGTPWVLPSAPFTHVRYWLKSGCTNNPTGVTVQVFNVWQNNPRPPDPLVYPNNSWQQFAFPLTKFVYPNDDPSEFVFREVLFVIDSPKTNLCHYYLDNLEFVSLDGCDLVTISDSSAPVKVGCSLPVVSSELAVGTISPIVNITSAATGTTVKFVLPQTGGEGLDSEGKRARTSTSGNNCRSSVVNCEWWKEDEKIWSTQGCTNNGTVSLGDGNIGVVCECVHLTLFALVSRSEFIPVPLCQTSTADFVFVALYGAIAVYCLIQMVRSRALCKEGPKNALISGCDTLALVLGLSTIVCLMRILSLLLKPVLVVGSLTILYALPSFLQLFVFTFLSITWFSIVRFAMQSNPFQRFRIFFYGLNVLYFICTVGISIALATTTDELTSYARAGAYLLAIFSLVLGLALLISGVSLAYQLRQATKALAGSVNSSSLTTTLMIRSLVVACLLASCWCGQAIAGFIATSETALDTENGLENADLAFYVFDVMCLVLLLYFFYSAVEKAIIKKDAKVGNSSSMRESSQRREVSSTNDSQSSKNSSHNFNHSSPNLVSPASHSSRR